jgi:hypothetical protein
MFAIPAAYGERCIDENFLHTLSMHEVYKRRTAQRSAANHSPDVISAGIALLRERIGRLRDHIGSGRVTIELYHGTVMLPSEAAMTAVQRNNSSSSSSGSSSSGSSTTGVRPTVADITAAALVSAITALRPHSMSWSNCIDYCAPQDFHTLARLCSAAGKTLHMAYSMNFPREVAGGMSLDMTLFEGSSGEDIRREFLQYSKAGVAQLYADAGWSSLLVSPPIDNALNIMDFFCALSQKEAWTKAFFAAAAADSSSSSSSSSGSTNSGNSNRSKGSSSSSSSSSNSISNSNSTSSRRGWTGRSRACRVANIDCSLYDLMSRAGPVISMIFTYDKTMHFRAVHD